MGIIKDIINFVDNTVTAVFTVVLGAISFLLQGIVWIVEAALSLVNGVTDWIDNRIESWWGSQEEAHANEAKATIINGENLGRYIEDQKRLGNYIEMSYADLMKIKNSTINIMQDKNGHSESEMIGSEQGYDESLRDFYKGKGFVSIAV